MEYGVYHIHYFTSKKEYSLLVVLVCCEDAADSIEHPTELSPTCGNNAKGSITSDFYRCVIYPKGLHSKRLIRYSIVAVEWLGDKLGAQSVMATVQLSADRLTYICSPVGNNTHHDPLANQTKWPATQPDKMHVMIWW